MDETFTFLFKLFFDKMIKKWMNSHIKVVAQLSKLRKNVTNVCGKRNREKYLDLCLFFKICSVTNSFPELKQNIGKEDINFPFY